jgi:hypothetical protein
LRAVRCAGKTELGIVAALVAYFYRRRSSSCEPAAS